MFRAPDSNVQVEQNEKLIAASLEISDNQQDEEEGEDEELSLLLHRHIQNLQSSSQRKRRAPRYIVSK